MGFEELYVVAANGDVWSRPRRRVGKRDSGWLKLKFQYAGKLNNLPYVELQVTGSRPKRKAVFDLLKQAWPEIFPDFMRRYGYV